MPFTLDYLLLVFVASCGVLQIAVTYSNLKGLYLFKTPSLNVLSGLTLIVVPLVWFFVSEPRNLPDTNGGLDGNQQAFLFVTGSLLGIVFTFILTSLRQFDLRKIDHKEKHGLDALRHTTFLWALRSTLRDIWKH